MKKVLKILLYIILGIVAFGLILAGFGTLGLKEAKALDIASIDLSQVPDGEYEGSYQNGRWSNEVSVEIKDGGIESIEIISSGNSSQMALLDEITDAVIAQQHVDIDTVSGATATSKSLLKAIENALIDFN